MKDKPATEYALLGALTSGPRHGYEILQFLETGLGPAWRVSTSQFYALLKRLDKEGLVNSTLGMRVNRMDDLYKNLKERAFDVWKSEGLLTEKVEIRARALSTEEAIGSPEHNDFPIQKGKEKLMQATFKGAGGQAFTDMCGDYRGTLEEVLGLKMNDNHQRSVFVASLNAVLRHLDLIEGSIHCKDEEPVQCGKALIPFLKERHRIARIAQVGFQPRMVENLGFQYDLRVLDMDPDNVGEVKFGVTIESAEHTEDAIDWADLILATGTTLANGTIESLLGEKPVIFYGTTIAGAAHLMGWERFCPCSL